MIGGLAWGSNPIFMPIALLILPAWYYANNRFIAWLTLFFYFAAASRGLPLATMTYFQVNLSKASVDWMLGVLFVSLPFLFLYFKNNKHRLIGLLISLVLIALPPFGLICWTHPLAGIGIFWPGGGWLALATTFLFIPIFCRWPVTLILPITIGLTINHSPTTAIAGWKNLNTHFSGTVEQANAFAPLTVKNFRDELIKQSQTIKTINESFDNKTKIILLPESSGGTWFSGNDQLWQSRLTWPGIALVGATIKTGQYQDSVIMAVSTTEIKPIYKQRQPVPISMWRPGHKNSYLAHWFNNPTVSFQDQQVAFFICYEQFLTWPVLQSLWHKPDLFCATSSIWWAKDTNIPAIQHNIMLSWSQLFSVPLLTAINL
jgi:hypothetical protein